MRLQGEITINFTSPVSVDLIGVYFSFNGKKYSWLTSSWKSGKNPIPYSKSGDKYKVSFTVCDDDKNVRNLRILNSK